MINAKHPPANHGYDANWFIIALKKLSVSLYIPPRKARESRHFQGWSRASVRDRMAQTRGNRQSTKYSLHQHPTDMG